MNKVARLLLSITLVSWGCGGRSIVENQERIAALEATRNALRVRLDARVDAEPLVASVMAEQAPVVLAIRSGLIEELAGQVARRYLDQVNVDVGGMDTHSQGEVHKKTFLGDIKVGGWKLTVDIGRLVGSLRAGTPSVRLRAPDLIDVDLPVDVLETEGDVTLNFWWDSAGIANLLCKNFRLTRTIQGRVVAQRHSLRGALRVVNNGESLDATPEFADRKLRLQIDLSPASWKIVSEALRSQEAPGTCGALMNPDLGMKRLRALAGRGVNVRLPDAMFRTFSLPARVRQSAQVGNRTVSLVVGAHSLHVDPETLWSSARVTVQSVTPSNASPPVQ